MELMDLLQSDEGFCILTLNKEKDIPIKNFS